MAERDVFTPVVFYQDPKAALAWLERAFGFDVALLVTTPTGEVGHAEMSFRGANVGVGGEWDLGGVHMKSPKSLGASSSQFVWVSLEDGLDAHCERARKAGARIVQEPEEQFYGDRTYRALDPEGHVWCFRQPSREVSLEEMERASGLSIKSKE